MSLAEAVALRYQAVAHWNFRRVEECETVLAWLDPRPGERVLDVGCGDGYYDALMAGRGAEVVGIDIHARRLATARRLHAGERATFLTMDAQAMTFPDAVFDKVVSFCVVEHFPHDERVLAHVHRVLKPGGALVLSADSLSNPGVTEAERARHRTRYAVNSFYTVESVGAKLAAAGFVLEATRYILTTPVTLGLARLSWRLDDLPSALAPVAWLGYAALGTAGKALSDASERYFGAPDRGGLTLLVRARKR